jgi:protein-disulfide isomerase
MKTKLGLGLAAIVAVGGLALWQAGPQEAGMTTLLPSMAAEAQEATAETAVDAEISVPDMVLGDPDAKVKIVEYASYTCPHCATFHEAVFKPLKAEYIDTGKVHFTYREIFFDRYGLWAAMMARCGGETRYFGINGVLLEKQREWAGSEDPLVVVENLKKIGRMAGMDDPAIQACLEDGAMAKAMVEVSQANATADAVQGTPTLMINGTKHPNMSYADLKAIIETELAK